jgi:hypothetical protein
MQGLFVLLSTARATRRLPPNAFTYRQPFRKFSSFAIRKTLRPDARAVGGDADDHRRGL